MEYLYSISHITISGIISDVCNALFPVLNGKFLKVLVRMLTYKLLF